MRAERFGIYCFNDEKSLFAPLRYEEGSGQTIGTLVYLGAWIQKVIVDNKDAHSKRFPIVPSDFTPKVLAYSTFKEIKPNKLLDRCIDNIFVVFMPGFVPANLAVLQLSLESRYHDYLRTNGIELLNSDKSEDILEIKPNYAGVGINFNALWKKCKKWLRRL
jgi:hypothetical protein